MTPASPADLFVRAMTVTAANWEVLYRTALTTTANTNASMVRMAETATQIVAPPTGAPFDVDVPQAVPVSVDGHG